MPNGIVFCAVAGTGKATIITELIALRPDLFETVGSATTRAPKKEAHGKKYLHTSHEGFEAMIANESVLEWNKYPSSNEFGFNYYGTTRASYEDIVNRGKIALFDLEINGLKQLKKILPSNEILGLFLSAELEEIIKRLTKRGTESAEEIATRIETGKQEIALVPELKEQGIIDEVIWYGAGAHPGITANEILNFFLKYNHR